MLGRKKREVSYDNINRPLCSSQSQEFFNQVDFVRKLSNERPDLHINSNEIVVKGIKHNLKNMPSNEDNISRKSLTRQNSEATKSVITRQYSNPNIITEVEEKRPLSRSNSNIRLDRNNSRSFVESQRNDMYHPNENKTNINNKNQQQT